MPLRCLVGNGKRQLLCSVKLVSKVFPSARRVLSTTCSDRVQIIEVGPRDGLQNVKKIVPTTVKLELIRRLIDTGLQNIETTSFTSAKWVPQLADGHQVLTEALAMTKDTNIRLPVLVPNEKGLESAVIGKARDIVVFASASEGFSWKNTNCSVEDGLKRAEIVTRQALSQDLTVRGVVSCVVSCPYDGPTDPQKVLEVVRRFLDMGCYEVGLGDTIGTGAPATIVNLLQVLMAGGIPMAKLAGHFHDTYGQAIANVVKAYELGIRVFDSSVAGLGGCPYAKGATGNLATEDLAYTLNKAGIETGVDFAKLADTGDWISKVLELPNNSRAGKAFVQKQASTSKSTDASPTSDSAKKKLSWQIVTDKGDYRIARAGNGVKITLSRPKNGNALTTAMVEGITDLFRHLANDPQVFHIVLEAEGKFFCTGMDLSTSGSSASESESEKAIYYEKVKNLFKVIETAPQTTIAAMNGSCFGGGVGLAFACDIRLVSDAVGFTMTEIKLGLRPGIISRFLVREWGVSFLREAMLTGRTVSGKELHKIGVVHRVCDDVDGAVADYLQQLNKCAPKSAAKCKELILSGYEYPGSSILEGKIQNTFAQMMGKGSEGEYGMEQFRLKNKGGLDWASFWAAKARS